MEEQTLFGLPIVINENMHADQHEILVGSFPRPERADMTLDEYAAQCARYFTKIRLDTEPQT